MKLITAIFFFFCFQIRGQQNFVPNWSFENFSSCPSTGQNNLHYALPWFQPNYASTGPGGSTDIFNACISNLAYKVPNNTGNFQYAKSGVSYIGFGVFKDVLSDSNRYREYCEVELTDTLTLAKDYCIKFYVSNVNLGNCSYIVDKIGCYLSQDSVLSFNPNYDRVPVVPQVENSTGIISDTISWTEIKGIYSANGTEKFLTIGNFRPFYQLNVDTMCPGGGFIYTTYYFLDDVSVYELPETNAGNDTTICPWHSTTIGPQNVRTDVQYSWQPTTGLSNPNIANPIASPMVNTTYVLTVTDTNQWACYPQMYDTVIISVSGCTGISNFTNEIKDVKVFPNPFSGSTTFSFPSEGNYELTIFDIAGKKVDSGTFSGKQFEYENHFLQKGIYFYEIENSKHRVSRGKLILE
jgi:hypothetical protein